MQYDSLVSLKIEKLMQQFFWIFDEEQQQYFDYFDTHKFNIILI